MATRKIHRIEVRPKPGFPDVRGDAACREAQSLGLAESPGRISVSSVYLLDGAFTDQQLKALASDLLADPVSEDFIIGATPSNGSALIEIHPLPGVMDPDAEAVETAIKASLGIHVRVRTGRRYDMHLKNKDVARSIAERCFANAVIHAIHDEPYIPHEFPQGTQFGGEVQRVSLSTLDDSALLKLSRDAHLFLSLDEMNAIRDEYKRLNREPTEIELETIAQTWSEHCVHKTLKATIRYQETTQSAGIPIPRYSSRPGHELNPDGSITIHNLLKSTIVAATEELMNDGIDWCLSVFKDNSGVIAFDSKHAVCFKVETHNHPSAIEPYGGAATGIGGCIRDIIGTGLAAKPIASTDVFCVAHPDCNDIPTGCLHPRRILSQVVAGVRDYGNRMGIPTLNGAVWFDNDYVGNPLVYCGCVGVLPRDRVKGEPKAGDLIIAIGGRTGRDGIHGATFSSAELTDTHADEFSHAVQIGNAVTEKKMLDAVLAARDHTGGCLFNAITDCGAGGFSSAVGEMGEKLGAIVHLERAPLKYDGLSPTEIWISEAQERMVLAVPPKNLESLQHICRDHDLELCELGHFGTDNAELILNYQGKEFGRLSMYFLHDGLPNVELEASFTSKSRPSIAPKNVSHKDALFQLLAHPNIASKHWIIRQYDHEVQGRSVIKPITGAFGIGPSDAAVIQPVANTTRGLAVACGLATGWKDDPYLMALAAIDECVRNLVCVGADPELIAILDNFCWPSCDDPEQLGGLVRAAEGCYDGAIAYRTPFISGKDSLNNQFTTDDGRTIRIPPTLLISGMGIVPDIRHCVTMDAKAAGNLLIIVGETSPQMGGSHYEMLFGSDFVELPVVNLSLGPKIARGVSNLIAKGIVRSAHDCSEGGLLVAATEMAFAGNLGLDLDLTQLSTSTNIDLAARCFAETPSRYLLEVESRHRKDFESILDEVPWKVIGEFNESNRFRIADAGIDASINDLRDTWMNPLNW